MPDEGHRAPHHLADVQGSRAEMISGLRDILFVAMPLAEGHTPTGRAQVHRDETSPLHSRPLFGNHEPDTIKCTATALILSGAP